MIAMKLIFRSLIYYRRIHIWVVLGTMVSTTIIVGALIIGDSIRYSLRQIVFDRLGSTEFALMSEDRFFETHIADSLSEKLRTPVAPLIQAKGMAIVNGGKQRVNNVRVVGFDPRFGTIGNTPGFNKTLAADEAIINDRIASRLHIKEGDEIQLWIQKPDLIPKDISWALDSGASYAKRCMIISVVSQKEFGGFNLKADQIAPNTVFVSLDFLGRDLGVAHKANVLLVAENCEQPFSIATLNDAFRESWSVSATGYALIRLPEKNQVELRSERIFLDSSVVHAAQKTEKNTQLIFSYFVNEIRLNDRAAPYSFVSASSDFDLREDEILINEWLADDLKAQPGDRIRLTYYIVGPTRALIETSSDFQIKSVVPIGGVYADRSLIPDFPGLTDAGSCREWEAGIPIDLDFIRPKDEAYWDRYRGTPKAFLSLRTAQKMWGNRFGDLTAIRFPGKDNEKIEENLTHAIDPADLGFYFRDVKSEGLQASTQSPDFAQLFLGLSFFIIIAALILTGLLYIFNSEQRAEETGLFLALGFAKYEIRRLILFEGMILVIIGSLVGAVCGIVYNQMVFIALKSVWRGIVGTSSLQIHVRLSTIVLAASIGVIINMLTILLVAGKQLKQPIAELQKGIAKLDTIQTKKPGLSLAAGVVCLIGVVVILIFSTTGRERDVVIPFLSAGFLLLTGGISFVNLFFVKKSAAVTASTLSLITIGIRNTVRKRFSSLAIVGLLACGIFIVFTVGANRRSMVKDAEKRESGTGGFALYGECVIPLLYDLNSAKGRDFYGLNTVNAGEVKFVSFRVKEGDDASCLNLNRVSTPQLIGMDPGELSKRGAFSFVKTTEEVNPDSPWDALEQDLSDDVIPGVADQTVIVWGLGKSLGDTMLYVDESGKTFKVKFVGGLANSIFQGNIIISEKAFIKKYPSISGSRLFLADAPFSGIEDISQKISWALQDQGIELIKTYDRLSQFNQVENMYLSIFLILGTFGLILGSVGIGIVIGRNVSERRGELALLRSVGFRRKAIQLLVVSEHSVLLFSGVSLGIVSALLATLPALISPGTDIPYGAILVLLILVVVNGGFWICSATVMATNKDLLPALRNE